MQFVTRVAEHLSDAATIEILKALAKGITDLLGVHTLLSRQRLVMLVDVVVFQPLKSDHRIIQASRGHAPRANGRTHQIHRLCALGQPVAKNEAVQGAEDQAFGATRCTRYDTNVFRQKAMFSNMGQGLGTRMNVEGLHGVYFFKPCSLAKALAMAEPAPGAGGEV